MRHWGMVSIMSLIIAGSAHARPPIATPADSAAFSAECDSKLPRATCICAVNTLQRSLEGQITLDSYAISVRYEGAKPPHSALLTLVNRYNLRASEFKAIADGIGALARETVANCR